MDLVVVKKCWLGGSITTNISNKTKGHGLKHTRKKNKALNELLVNRLDITLVEMLQETLLHVSTDISKLSCLWGQLKSAK